MKKSVAIIIFLFTSLFLNAERIKEDVDVYTEPGKDTYARLYKGSGIYVGGESDGWTKIIAVVTAPKTGFDEYTLLLPKKTIIYDAIGQETGRLYGQVKLPASYRYDNKNVIFELTGYIRTSEVDTNWVPEQALIKKIDSAKSKVGFTDLQTDLERFQFYLQLQDSTGFECYQLNDIVGLNYKNPVERLRLIFYEKRLVAIFHKKPFKLKSKEVIVIDGSENLIFLRDLNAQEKRIFSRLFLGY